MKVAQSAGANMDTIARIVKDLFPQTAGIYAGPEK